MPKKKAKPRRAVMGAPRKEINWEEFDKLCDLQATFTEIAAWFNVSEDTIERRVKEKYGITFAECFAQKRGKGKVSLRRLQFAAAQAGNPTMLVWLGKQWLGQTDRQELTGKDGGPIETKNSFDWEAYRYAKAKIEENHSGRIPVTENNN